MDGPARSPLLTWGVRTSVRRPRRVLGAWLALCALAALGVARLEFDPTTESILHQQGPAWAFYQQSVARFGGDEILVVAFESERPYGPALIARIAALTERFEALPGVRRVDSLTTVPVIRNDATGELRLDPALPESPSRADVSALPDALTGDRIAPQSLVSDDGRVLAINLLLEGDLGHRVEAILDDVRAAIAETPGWVSGVPIFRTESNLQSQREIVLFVPATLLAIAALLFVAFGERRAVLVPLLASSLGSVVVLGAMGAVGTPLTFSTVVLPPLLLALGSAYTIHVLSAAGGHADADALERRVREVARPIALSGLTTAIGFLGIALVRIEAIRDLGAFGALGALTVATAALTAAPAALALAPVGGRAPRWRAWVGEVAGPALVAWLTRRGGVVIACWVVAIAALGAGLPRLDVETDATRWFPRESHVNRSYEAIRARLSGISPINVVVEMRDGASASQPEVIAAIDALATHLRAQPGVGKVLSIADPLRQLHATLAEEDGLPARQGLIEQYLLILGSVERLRDVVSDDHRSANVMLRVDDNSSDHLLAVARDAERWWERHGAPGTTARTTGIMFEFARAEDEIAWGQIRGLATSLAVITVIALVIFRSRRIAGLALVPNAAPLVLCFGGMGLAGVPLDAATVVVGCLALGIAVDDTIHLLAGFTAHPLHRDDPAGALVETFRRMLPPVLLTTLAIAIGFGVLGLSGFAITRNLGLLTALTVCIALLADVTLLPAVLLRVFGKRRPG